MWSGYNCLYVTNAYILFIRKNECIIYAYESFFVSSLNTYSAEGQINIYAQFNGITTACDVRSLFSR